MSPLHPHAPGRSGIGKGTLVNALFNATILPADRPRWPPSRTEAALHAYQATVRESGVSLHVEIIEAVGFGEFGHQDCQDELVDFVYSRHRKHFDREMEMDRGSKQADEDELIHAALFCFHPRITTGLTEKEVALMAKLDACTCVIPVITKADVYTPRELQKLKTTVQSQMQGAGLQPYLPLACGGDSQTRAAMLRCIQVRDIGS